MIENNSLDKSTSNSPQWAWSYNIAPIKFIKTTGTLEILLNLFETEMLEYFQPEKINIASFYQLRPTGILWCVFKEDSYFPKPI